MRNHDEFNGQAGKGLSTNSSRHGMSAVGWVVAIFVIALVGFGLWLGRGYRQGHRSESAMVPTQEEPHLVVSKPPAAKKPQLAVKPKPEPKPTEAKKVSAKKPVVKKVAKKPSRPVGHKLANVVPVAHPQHLTHHEWKHWGAAPFAHSFADSCRKAPWAIDHSSMPQPVKAHFKKVLARGCRGGDIVWYTPHTFFSQESSGPDRRHQHDWMMNDVTVAELPVTHSPHGRPYRKGSVAETARGREWRWVYDGKAYAWTIFDVCYNQAWRIIASQECATIHYRALPGDGLRFAFISKRRLESSACWQLCDGDRCSALPAPCDVCNWYGPKRVIPHGYYPLKTGRYRAHAVEQTLSGPLSVMRNYVALCINRRGHGESDSWVIRPSAWKGQTSIHVPYGGQQWPVWGPGAIDWSRWK